MKESARNVNIHSYNIGAINFCASTYKCYWYSLIFKVLRNILYLREFIMADIMDESQTVNDRN